MIDGPDQASISSWYHRRPTRFRTTSAICDKYIEVQGCDPFADLCFKKMTLIVSYGSQRCFRIYLQYAVAISYQLDDIHDFLLVPPGIQVVILFVDDTITLVILSVQDPEEVPSLFLLLKFFWREAGDIQRLPRLRFIGFDDFVEGLANNDVKMGARMVD